MKKTRKGFTLVEAVITIAVLGTAFALTGVAISQLVVAQNNSASQVANEDAFNKADSLIREYVSYVGIDTYADPSRPNGLSFSYVEPESPTTISLCFRGRSDSVSCLYTLSYVSETKQLIVYTYNESTEDHNSRPSGYLGQKWVAGEWGETAGLSGVSFVYDDTLQLLTADIALSQGGTRRFAYVVRTGR